MAAIEFKRFDIFSVTTLSGSSEESEFSLLFLIGDS